MYMMYVEAGGLLIKKNLKKKWLINKKKKKKMTYAVRHSCSKVPEMVIMDTF